MIPAAMFYGTIGILGYFEVNYLALDIVLMGLNGLF